MPEYSFHQKQASELQERLAALVESSDDAIIGKDLNGIIQSWNSGAERIFGYTAEEAIGRHISILAPPDRVDEIPGMLERIARGERIDHYVTKRRTKDGQVRTMSLTISPIRDTSGAIIGASKIARDITEREQQREALERANIALTRLNMDLQQFAYAASHDLREPLRMVSTYTSLVQRKLSGRLDAETTEYLNYIIDGSNRMRQLLDSLLAYARASTAGQVPAPALDGNAAVDAVIMNLQSMVAASGAIITRTELPTVRMHRFELEQLFQNLIANAIRYRREKPPRIHVAAERLVDHFVFSVSDNGIGIDPQYQEQIFEMFNRLHTTAEHPGTGMGLAICQRIVERAGGRIWVESQPDKGSTFYFSVPAL